MISMDFLQPLSFKLLRANNEHCVDTGKLVTKLVWGKRIDFC